ncbi:hypothetical protein PCASD_13623 [Puccinia coronata f. sp. avenae]|uniref:Uncharacterized protein n=1 Tax=Puccinia coronata f. sp. avenae TaxID=200324 RepID=A0A2N5TDE2_9BASI|nr:hypothetical protein PCASD_13623 [Puccinia coronata f. sp. avenae]
MCKQWLKSKALSKKMVLATEAAAQPDILLQLPPENPSSHHPLSTSHPQIIQFPHPQPTPVSCDPDSMEIDAVLPEKSSLMDVTQNICQACQLCFHCLKPIVPGTHTGSINCLHALVKLEQCKAFVERARQTPTSQVAGIQTDQMPLEVKSPLTYHPGALFAAPSSPVFPSPFELEDLHGHNELYNNDEDYKEAEVVTVPVLTGHV